LEYTINDLKITKKHIMTADMKYYLSNDGAYDYWKTITDSLGNELKLGYALGHHSYDYCFRSDLNRCIDKLNKILSI